MAWGDEAWGDFVWGEGASVLTCTIGSTSYSIMGLRVTERTGGEASPMEFRVPLSAVVATPISRGAEVTIVFAPGLLTRTWTGTVESLSSEGAEVTVSC